MSAIQVQRSFDLNYDTSMQINAALDAGAVGKMWAHIAKVWSGFGENDAIWSVITDERLKTSEQPTEDVIDAFYASGVGDLNVYLYSADGTRTKLLERNCGGLLNIDTTFDDSATTKPPIFQGFVA